MSSYTYIRTRIPWWLKWTGVWLVCLVLSLDKSWAQCSTSTYPLCSGASYTLTAPVGVNQIKWYKDGVLMAGNTSATLTVSTAGNYTWAATNTATTCRDSLCCPVKVVTCNEYPLCLGETYTLTTPAGLTNIQWYKDGVAVTAPTGQAASLVVSTVGNYTWAGTNATTTCRDSLCTPVKIIVCESYPICAGESYTLTGPTGLANIQWYKDGVAVTAPTGQATSLIVSTLGHYTWAGTNSTTTCRDSLCTPVKIIAGNCPKGSIGDYVWKDANRNGRQDLGEVGVNGVKVILWSATTTGTPVAKLDSTTTAGVGTNAGKYLFSNLLKGDYAVQFVKSTIPAECSGFTAKDTTAAGTTDKNDSDADKITGITAKVSLDPKVLSATSTAADSLATNNLTVDAGLVAALGSIGDLIWKDVNDNGLQDLPTEKGVAGVKVNLYAASASTKTGSILQTKTTGTDGLYLFTGLLAGNYILEIDKTTLADTCAITSKQNIPGDDTKDSDFSPATGLSPVITLTPVFNPTTPAEILATNNLTVDAGLVVPCAKSKVTVTAAPVCSADVQTYSLSFSVTGKVGTVKVNKGTLTGSNPYTVTGIPSGAAVKITDSLSAVCTFDTLITGPNCNCNPPLPTLVTPSLTACIGDTFPTLKATVIGLATVEWFIQPTGGTAVFTGLNYKPAGTVTTAGAVFYAQARSTDPTCPTAISTGRVMSTVNAQDCTKEVDLALKKSINIKIAQIDDVLTYTLKVWNESTTNATGVEVTDSIATTVQFQTGSFTASRGTASISGKVIKWVIGDIAAGGDTVTLTYRVKATQEGVHFNTAEISKVNEKDIDSTPGNGKEGEDDIDRECFTVPLKLCPGEKAEVNVPAQLTNVQWFKNGGTTAVANGNTVLLSEVGTYTFTATNQACPANGCCPIIIEAGVNCCPEDLCIPFTIKQTKKGKR